MKKLLLSLFISASLLSCDQQDQAGRDLAICLLIQADIEKNIQESAKDIIDTVLNFPVPK